MEEDYFLALEFQKSYFEEDVVEISDEGETSEALKPNSLVDVEWELCDPNPDIFALFQSYNEKYFWNKLGGVEVKWSPRMTSCAGICTYKGVGGCIVSLSLPLLKLRPRKDLVQTLLHEMIHAFLFVTRNFKDRSDHGPEFHKHMYRINKEAGTNITVYHEFHDEVRFYKTHWWRCNGPCQKWPPFYGLVKRAMNRAPGPNDFWHQEHQNKCGGTFVKIREPPGYRKKRKPETSSSEESIKKPKVTSKVTVPDVSNVITERKKAESLKFLINRQDPEDNCHSVSTESQTSDISNRTNSKFPFECTEDVALNNKKTKLQIEQLELQNYKLKLEILELERRLKLNSSNFTKFLA